MAQVRLESVPALIEKAGEIRKGIARSARYAGNVHIGGPMSAADITVALYYKFMGFDPEDTEKPVFTFQAASRRPALQASSRPSI